MIIYFSGPDDILFEVHKCHVEKWAAIDIHTFPEKHLRYKRYFLLYIILTIAVANFHLIISRPFELNKNDKAF